MSVRTRKSGVSQTLIPCSECGDELSRPGYLRNHLIIFHDKFYPPSSGNKKIVLSGPCRPPTAEEVAEARSAMRLAPPKLDDSSTVKSQGKGGSRRGKKRSDIDPVLTLPSSQDDRMQAWVDSVTNTSPTFGLLDDASGIGGSLCQGSVFNLPTSSNSLVLSGVGRGVVIPSGFVVVNRTQISGMGTGLVAGASGVGRSASRETINSDGSELDTAFPQVGGGDGMALGASAVSSSTDLMPDSRVSGRYDDKSTGCWDLAESYALVAILLKMEKPWLSHSMFTDLSVSPAIRFDPRILMTLTKLFVVVVNKFGAKNLSLESQGGAKSPVTYHQRLLSKGCDAGVNFDEREAKLGPSLWNDAESCDVVRFVLNHDAPWVATHLTDEIADKILPHQPRGRLFGVVHFVLIALERWLPLIEAANVIEAKSAGPIKLQLALFQAVKSISCANVK